MEHVGHRVIDPVVRSGEGANRLLPLPGLGGDHSEPLEVLPQAGLEAADPERLARVVIEVASFDDQRGELPELLAVEGEVRP